VESESVVSLRTSVPISVNCPARVVSVPSNTAGREAVQASKAACTGVVVAVPGTSISSPWF
jgi:hypothetical protein